MTTLPTAPSAGADPDWDAIIDNPYHAGPLVRVSRAGNWWLVVGMRLDLADAIQRPGRIKTERENEDRLLIFADTVTAQHAADAPILCHEYEHIVVMARRLEAGAQLLLEKRGWEVVFRLGFYVGYLSPATLKRSVERWMRWNDPQWGQHEVRGKTDLPNPLVPRQVKVSTYPLDEKKPLPFFEEAIDLSALPLPACKALLERMLFAAQALGMEGKGEQSLELLSRMEGLIALTPDVAAWQDVALGCRSAQELLRPVSFDPNQVPYLSASFYGDLAKEHVPALQAYAGTFARLSDRSYDLAARKQAAKQVLGEKDDANAFQKLVGQQLAENLRLATANVKRAQDCIEPQSSNVRRAEAEFKRGMDAWKAAKEREAALAIVGAVFSFVSGVASMFGGNAAGAAGAAKAAADVASTAAKLAEIMKVLVKVGQAIEKIVKMCMAIVAAVDKIDNAKKFADDLSAITRETLSEDAKGAPSAAAHWDQMWVEIETQLAPAIQEGVGGAEEYLKELKILVIYGRALTTAQAALPPLVQEIARSKLQTEIARRQHDAVAREIDALKKEQTLSGQAMVVLWGNYRAVQRSMLVALTQFDAAYRYWALSDVLPARDNHRGIADLAGDLVALADLKKLQARALESFNPPPQPYTRQKYALPAHACQALLKGERVDLRFTPTYGPMANWGRISRVRVNEIYVWVEWAEGQRPKQGEVEFTVRTNGAYDDRRLVQGQMKEFHFHGVPVNLTFRYDLAGTPPDQPGDCIRVRAAIAEDFRTSYSEPTLYTDWVLSSPKVEAGDKDTVDLTQLKAAIKGIRVEFAGTFIKDPDKAF
ncbi:hypothetical protein [Lysobacter silvisoli]|uniref:hypothetical protein n=1 Tax=Lysobacter silvisoli TaxID=2293254 RepID=UPI001314E48A|nr:hypothetical protein [Lysobacter silvisoli]